MLNRYRIVLSNSSSSHDALHGRGCCPRPGAMTPTWRISLARARSFLKGKFSKARALLRGDRGPRTKRRRRASGRVAEVMGGDAPWIHAARLWSAWQVRRCPRRLGQDSCAAERSPLRRRCCSYRQGVVLRTGEYEKAIKELRALVAAKRGGYEAHYRLGMNIAAAGKHRGRPQGVLRGRSTRRSDWTVRAEPMRWTSCYLAKVP